MKIYNAKIYTMNASREVIENGWVSFEGRYITAVGAGLPDVAEGDIDAHGAGLYPGFIDAHTHVGLSGCGAGVENDDFNEESEPCAPHLRIADAINAFDPSFELALRAGITTVLISPGSMNPIAGDICAVSTMGRRIDSMVLRRVGIKFALGENPKMTYMNRDESPVTRMAIAAIIREELLKTQRYIKDTDLAEEESDLPELDMKHEALIPLLEGGLTAHFHCHRADDIFTAIRLAREFGLNYTLIHCSEGHLIAEELAEEGACAVVGPIMCDPCKPELANISPTTAGVLAKSGVKTAICTDHPETPIQYLPITVGIAIKHGLPFDKALEAVTINAAEIGGIGDIVGSVEKGKRADMVLFAGNPFEVMSSPQLVVCGGKVVK